MEFFLAILAGGHNFRMDLTGKDIQRAKEAGSGLGLVPCRGGVFHRPGAAGAAQRSATGRMPVSRGSPSRASASRLAPRNALRLIFIGKMWMRPR